MGANIILIATYFIILVLSTVIFSKKANNKAYFLLADRKLGQWGAAFSIAATWIWAPALFISSQKAYTHGIVGLFWFIVPNVLCLILFGFFASKVVKMYPSGFTLSKFIKTRYSERVQKVYLVELLGLATCSFAVQLLAGGKVLSILTGVDFFTVTVGLSLIALSYTLFSGLKASVVTDFIQMIIIVIVALIIVPMVVSESEGITTLMQGIGGHSKKFTNLFSSDGISVFFSFGLVATIGLLAGPFGDQSFYQRAFAIPQKDVRGAFIKGAILFAIVPIMLSAIGFIAAGKGMVVADTGMVNIHVIKTLFGSTVTMLFLLMLLSGLISTLDSNLCAVSSILGEDFSSKINLNTNKGMMQIRVCMILFTVFPIIISNLPGIKILYLFLFYGTLRSSVFLPTVLSISKRKISEHSVFWGIIIALAAGLPVFLYGKFNGSISLTIAGTLITFLIPGISIALFGYTLDAKEASVS